MFVNASTLPGRDSNVAGRSEDADREDCPQVGVSYIQRTDLLHGLLQGQGCRGKVEGLGHFLGGRDKGVDSQWLFFLSEAQVRHKSQQRARSEWDRRGLRRHKHSPEWIVWLLSAHWSL